MLADVPWYKGIYRIIHQILSLEGRVPPAEEISLLGLEDFDVPPPLTVLGCAAPGVGVWFRFAPPSPITFAHELIHLARKEVGDWEELYAYNLAAFVVWLAERRIRVPVNPLRLFEDVDEHLLLEAIHRVFKVKFESLGEFFIHIGVIPPFLELVEGRFKVKKEYSEKMIVIESISELAAGAEFSVSYGYILLQALKLTINSPHKK